MDFNEIVRTRRSIRRFLDIPVEFEKLGEILENAIYAPSAGNLQDWKFILITDKEKIEGVAEACYNQEWIGNSPVCLIACVEPSKTRNFYGDQGEKYSLLNGGAAIQNILLSVHNEGLASCWVCAFEDEMLKRNLSIPDDIIVAGVLPIGYADEKVPVPPRNDIEDVTFIESWGNKIGDLAGYMEWYGEHVQKALKKAKHFIANVARRLQK